MKKITLLFMAVLAIAGCRKTQPAPSPVVSETASVAVEGPFSSQELQQFAALNPVDTHTHVYQTEPAFLAMLQKLNLHIIDIVLVDDNDAVHRNFAVETRQAWNVVHASKGRAVLCTTFDPYKFKEREFAKTAIRQINENFDQGAVAVKIWKNIGMEIKDEDGNYILPDNPVFEPIYKDIAAHDKTLIAHVADPNVAWEAPNPNMPGYSYFMQHPEWLMYGNPHPASKENILAARDHVLEENPNLRVVGAHLGSMEADFTQLARHLDLYPNLAVDLAARVPYLMLGPRAEMIAFITKYQDRLIYATDDSFYSQKTRDVQTTMERLEESYASDWRFLATDDTLDYHGHKVQGLALPQPILRKLYHDNAVRWFPGILGVSH